MWFRRGRDTFRRVMTPKQRWFLLPFLATLALDQITKRVVMSRFYYGETVGVIPGFFDLTYVRNPGGAFSFFAGGPSALRMTFFVGMTLIAIGVLVAFYRRLEPDAPLSAAALGTILGGAVGNLIDRLAYGEVVDFLDFHIGAYTWPTFNVADMCIVVGVGVLVLEIFIADRAEVESVPAGQPNEIDERSV
jgi:signal peptidase II